MARTLLYVIPLALIPALGLMAWRHSSHSHPRIATDAAYSTELMAGIGRMHAAMSSAQHTGDADLDFVNLMLPHHRGAVDMAKTEILYGKDPQMRRLAQEIVTDQESEIQLMRLWRQHYGESPDRSTQQLRRDTQKEQ